MTRPSLVRDISYQGDGSDVTFAIPFDYFDDDSFVRATLIDETDADAPVRTTLASPTHYSINTSTDVLTMVTAPTVNQRIFLELILPFKQLSNYVNGNAFDQTQLTADLDKLVVIMQNLKYDVSRAAKHEVGNEFSEPLLPVPDTGHVLKWASTGKLENGPTDEQIEDAEQFAADAQSSAQGAANSASSASNSAAAAAVSETNAAASASSVGTSVTDAQQAATDAQTAQAAAEAAQAAAETAEANAATSEANAATSETNASTSAANALTSENNAETAETNAEAAQAAAEAAQAAAEAAQAAAEAAAAGAGGGFVVEGTRAAPANVTALGGIVLADNTKQRIKKYINGNSAPIDITANPQITAGTIDGQELLLVGRDDTNTVKLDDGTGLVLQGPCFLGADQTIMLCWDGANWVEINRSL